MARKRLDSYLVPGKHIHLIGIGGVSMRPLGLVLRGMGMKVTGSDMNSSVSTDELISKGIEVKIGHNASNIDGADCIIRTAAAHNDNPEIAAARAMGIPVFERAQAWGVIMREYKNAICISGTHGKTTTTSMMTHILMEAGKDPTVMIGGYLPILHAGHRVPAGGTGAAGGTLVRRRRVPYQTGDPALRQAAADMVPPPPGGAFSGPGPHDAGGAGGNGSRRLPGFFPCLTILSAGPLCPGFGGV